MATVEENWHISGDSDIAIQKQAIGELYRVIPFSSCAFNVCGIYVSRSNFSRTLLRLERIVMPR